MQRASSLNSCVFCFISYWEKLIKHVGSLRTFQGDLIVHWWPVSRNAYWWIQTPFPLPSWMGSVQPELGQGLREGSTRKSCRKQALVSSFYPENQAQLIRTWMIVTLFSVIFSFFCWGWGWGWVIVKNYFAPMRVESKYQLLRFLLRGILGRPFPSSFTWGNYEKPQYSV